jgi:hypothetical protein
MSGKRYIQLYSGNRNRQEYANPAQFNVPYASTHQIRTPLDAVDPVLSGQIYYYFQLNPQIIEGTFQSSSTQSAPQLDPLQHPQDGYDSITDAPVVLQPSVGDTIYLTIGTGLDYKQNDIIQVYQSDNVTISFKGVVSDYDPDTGDITIDNVSNIRGTFSTNPKYYRVRIYYESNPYYSLIPDEYVGWLLTSTDSGEVRQIKTFNPSTGVVTLDSLFSSEFNKSGRYCLQQAMPIAGQNYVFLPPTDTDGNKVSTSEQAYVGYYVVFESPDSSYSNPENSNIFYRQVTYYDNIYHVVFFDEPIPSDYGPVTNVAYFSLRKTLPMERWTVQNVYQNTVPPEDPEIGPQLGWVIQLPNTASSTDNFYKGKYVYYVDNAAKGKQTTIFFPTYGTYYIKAYNASTNELSVLPDINGAPFPEVGQDINIVNFTKDNYTPYLYNGTLTSLNQSVCYEVSLVSLTIPNAVLSTGSRIAYYSYLFVEFAPYSSSPNTDAPIYSNNPNSNRALFIAPITQSNQPTLGTFIACSSSMPQTVTFKPNDGFRFSVYLPDGTLFQTLEDDFFTPYDPNLFLQINAVFSISRVSK